MEGIVRLFQEYRYIVGNEADFQNGVAKILDLNRVSYCREYDLGQPFGRIDFYLPDHAMGIELKIKGGRTTALRQLHRYATSPQIHSLVLVTTRSALGMIPDRLNGKPIAVANVWQGQI